MCIVVPKPRSQVGVKKIVGKAKLVTNCYYDNNEASGDVGAIFFFLVTFYRNLSALLAFVRKEAILLDGWIRAKRPSVRPPSLLLPLTAMPSNTTSRSFFL